MIDPKLNHWTDEDHEVEEEFADIIPIIRKEERPVSVSHNLDKKVLRMVGQSPAEQLLDHWLLGSHPRVILVMLIFFAIALLTSLFF